MKLRPHHERPLRYLGLVPPEAWWQLDRMREDKGKGLPDWPEWCYLPIASGVAVATRGAEDPTIQQQCATGTAPAALVALAAWRVSKGIWDFDPDLFSELWDTPVEGALPTELLYRLPEWCPYICTPGAKLGPLDVAGTFVHLEADANTGLAELRFLLDTKAQLEMPGAPELGTMAAIPLHLDKPTVDECLDAAMQRTIANHRLLRPLTDPRFASELAGMRSLLAMQRELVGHLLSLVLYLCSADPDLPRKVQPRPGTGKKPLPKPAREPLVWDVGIRVGAALRSAYGESHDGAETGRTVRPHMRRAHWHHYRVGPKRERLELRWIAPVAVGAGEAPAVVRPVR